MKILVIPGNVHTAKSYPYWDQLLELLKDHEIRRVEGVLPLQQVIDQINWCNVWITIDSFLPHLVVYHKLKRGVVIWGKSDPLIFGYPTNINLLKDRKYLKPNQFKWWKDEPDDPDVFVLADIVVQAVEKC